MAITLAVPSVAAAQDEVLADAIGKLRSSFDEILQRDGLTPRQVAVIKEMQASLDPLREEDLNPRQKRMLVFISQGLPGSIESVVQMVAGDGSNDEEAGALEAKLLEDPDDISSRTRLIRHYNPNRLGGSARARGEHVVWLIENAPYADELGPTGWNEIYRQFAPEAYDAGREAWRRHVEREPDNPVFLARYARFVNSTELLERAHRLDAQNPRLALELANAYLLAAMRPDEEDYDAQAAAKALTQFDRAYAIADNDIMRNGVLRERAWAAFAAGRYDLAKQDAQAILDANPFRGPDGDLLHRGNTILGRIALIEGDVARAKEHLLKSGKVPTSPVLGSFGPSMALASELLALGHREVVRDYFELCAVFWEADHLNAWRAALDAGQTPEFGSSAWAR